MPDGPLLKIIAVDAFYGDFQALFGVSLSVGTGQVVAVIGANGAGKSTLLKCIAGLMHPSRGEILFEGVATTNTPAFEALKRGIALVPEGRRLFPSLTVEENLLIGGQSRRPGPWTLARVYELFPILAERRNLPAPALSGGQQQMAAIGRALMSNPRLLLCDEISLGLAPIVRARHLRPPAANHSRRLVSRHRRAGHRSSPARGEPGLLPAGGPRRTAGRRTRPHPRKNFSRLFRGLTRCNG